MLARCTVRHLVFAPLAAGLFTAACHPSLGSISDSNFDATEPSTDTSTMAPTTTEAATDPATTATVICTPNAYRACQLGDLYWFDSCDVAGEFAEECGEYGCSNGVCNAECDAFYTVTSHACEEFSQADGVNFKTIRVCGQVDEKTGIMQVRAQNWDGSDFENRPYQVRVSEPTDPMCGPLAYHFNVSTDAPSGVGSYEIDFTFQSLWKEDQTEKAYCVTASMIPSDPGYIEGSAEQQSWWWSEKLVLVRNCLGM